MCKTSFTEKTGSGFVANLPGTCEKGVALHHNGTRFQLYHDRATLSLDDNRLHTPLSPHVPPISLWPLAYGPLSLACLLAISGHCLCAPFPYWLATMLLSGRHGRYWYTVWPHSGTQHATGHQRSLSADSLPGHTVFAHSSTP